jgi:hypothetical protein
MLSLRERLERPGSFVTAAELVTSRGLFSADSGRALQATARELAANPRIDVLSITDNPGGHAMLAPDTLGSDLLSVGQEVIIHLSCKDCGDCSLPEIAYVCPESMCAKNQRNGPCGGTRDGLCEVYDTECIWSQAYERLKAYGEEAEMLDGPVVVKDNALAGTSAWANTFLGRDHLAQHAPAERDEP